MRPNFGAGWAGSDHTLSTLRPAGHPARTQDSLPAVGQTLPGGLSVPLGSSERFLRCLLHRFPPFPGFPWRKRASVLSTCSLKPRVAARVGPTRRSTFGSITKAIHFRRHGPGHRQDRPHGQGQGERQEARQDPPRQEDHLRRCQAVPPLTLCSVCLHRSACPRTHELGLPQTAVALALSKR
jgi:hypothetical protein